MNSNLLAVYPQFELGTFTGDFTIPLEVLYLGWSLGQLTCILYFLCYEDIILKAY